MTKKYSFYVYIMASETGTLYIGMTGNLQVRTAQHKEGKIEGFSKKYSCKKLVYVYYEEYNQVYDAIEREKQLKKWRRKKKENLVNKFNPHWKDLYNDLL
ncbi:MAG: GIY-YIG nuclease family protein [Candidatus Pacebacteria bacterium]|nr:GIY-YIG nuclease family protein [Candidatus Paceibacterota bacterium]